MCLMCGHEKTPRAGAGRKGRTRGASVAEDRDEDAVAVELQDVGVGEPAVGAGHSPLLEPAAKGGLLHPVSGLVEQCEGLLEVDLAARGGRCGYWCGSGARRWGRPPVIEGWMFAGTAADNGYRVICA